MNTLARQFSESTIARWFRTLSKREQMLVYIVLVLIGVVISYLLFSFVRDYRDEQVFEYQQKLADLDWMEANVDQARLQAQMSKAGDRGDWSPIYRNAELHNVSIQRIHPGSSGASIELGEHAFHDVVNWIFALQDDAKLHIEQVRITKTNDPGVVTSTLVIQ